MFCAAMTKKAQPCKRGINTNATIYRDGFKYYLCGGSGHTENDNPKLNPERRTPVLSDSAIIQDPDGITHIDLKSGVETTQEQLPLTNQKENTMETITTFVRRVVREDDANIYVLPKGNTWSGTIEEFKALCQTLLNQEKNRSIKGFAARVSNRIFYVTRDKAVITSKQVKPVKVEKTRGPKPSVKEQPKPQATTYICGRCTKWAKTQDGKWFREAVTHNKGFICR